MTYRSGKSIQPLIYVVSSVAFAIDRDTGRQCWRYQASTRLMRIVYAVERIFMLDADCALHCVRAQDGVLLGKVQVDEKAYVGSAMLPGPNGEMYVATSHSIIALDASGREMWRFKHDGVPGSFGSGLAGLALPEAVVQPDIRD